MKKYLVFYLIAPIVLNIPVFAQETIYLANGTKLPVRLIEATNEEVKFGEAKGDQIIKRAFHRDNVILFFNAQGRYLFTNELSHSQELSLVQLADFYKAPSYAAGDIMVKSNPASAIIGTIQYESTKMVNYLSITGASGSIQKSELVAIIYRDGRHELFSSSDEAAANLSGILSQLKANKSHNPPGLLPATRVSTVTSNSQETNPPKPTADGLGKNELIAYHEKSLRRVDEFVQYLNIITDKSIASDGKDKAIEQALSLFLPTATIQVTSANRQGVRLHPIKDYLVRLKLLPYSSTKIQWHEVNYVHELTLANDGNYYGVISGVQTFTGYGDKNDNVVYSDLTKKNVKVKLQSYQKNVEGQKELNWEVFLGNIGVVVNN